MNAPKKFQGCGIRCLLLTAFLSFATGAAQGRWVYYGSFSEGSAGPLLGAKSEDRFSATVEQSSFGSLLTWSSAPPYVVTAHCNDSFDAQFAITTDATFTSFLNYGPYSSYGNTSGGFGIMTARLGGGTFGFATRNTQPIRNRFNVDYFKSWSMDVHTIPDYNAGRNPRRHRNRYSSQAWVQSGVISQGTAFFKLKENVTSGSDNATVTSFAIPRGSRTGTYSRYVWYGFSSLSPSQFSGLYIVAPSQLAAVMAGQAFSYYAMATNLHAQEIRLPFGSWYVVARNGRNIDVINAGSCTSQVVVYK